MPRLIKHRSRKAGLPPGSLVHIGDRKTERVRITVLEYDESSYRERQIHSVDEHPPAQAETRVVWINVEGLHEVEVLEKLGRRYSLHPLTLEDVLNTDQRPKQEDFGHYIYVVLPMITYDERRDLVTAEQVSLILGPNFVISFQEGQGDVFDPVRDRIRHGVGRIRKMGADYLAYSLLDAIVDNYFLALEKLGDRIDSVGDQVLAQPTPSVLQTIQVLRREMLFLRKAVWPLREVLGSLQRSESPLIKETTRLHLADVYDHTMQVIDTAETYREVLSETLDIYLSSVSLRLNEIMKVLTIVTTIFIPLTFVVGIYGMNFRHMPELDWGWAYPAVLAFMLAVALAMLVYFKRKGWL